MRTSAPYKKSSPAVSGVRPSPPAALSAFTTAKSIPSMFLISGRYVLTASMPDTSLTSPTSIDLMTPSGFFVGNVLVYGNKEDVLKEGVL